MGSLFHSEEVCLVQIFLQTASAYNCVSELGELEIVEFRDLNPNVNAFQRKFVSEVRRCEELEKTFEFLEQEIVRSLSQKLQPPIPTPPAPQSRELLSIEEDSERLARELREVSRNRDSLRSPYTQLCQYRGVLKQTHSLTASQAPLVSFEPVALAENRQDVQLSFVAGVVHPWKVPAFERLLWRACRGYIIVDFHEMEEKLKHPDSGEEVQWTVFLISFWGIQIGHKVKKICDWQQTHCFEHPKQNWLTGRRRALLPKFLNSLRQDTDQLGVHRSPGVNWLAVYTIITFPFLFAVMFGDVGHGLLMTLVALWMILEEKDSKLRKNTNEIWGLANNHLTFLNSYKMKMSVIIGVFHMTFGVCLSLFNYIHFNDISSVFLVLIPELSFMLCLFGYLIFMVIYRWVVYGPITSDSAPSILIHFIDMFLFTENKDNKPLYTGQETDQKHQGLDCGTSQKILQLFQGLAAQNKTIRHLSRADTFSFILQYRGLGPVKQSTGQLSAEGVREQLRTAAERRKVRHVREEPLREVDNLGKVRQVHRSAIKPWVGESPLVNAPECNLGGPIAPAAEEEEIGDWFVVVPDAPQGGQRSVPLVEVPVGGSGRDHTVTDNLPEEEENAGVIAPTTGYGGKAHKKADGRTPS
ncbi:V-type proton ATPase 116 kDa subunit a 3-like [Carassius carassius]|uniref:V-type proton ATPase 116 kDa subunit a 3-like n=1 Tax=Carassius carassius TaxID=217509 RepID=UPI0028690D23|nr:V-type proton ATPase 116 kDa subunit a 3-like [Carassius carassius]